MNATTEPQPAEEPQIVVIDGRKFEVVEWSWKDWDENDKNIHQWELWAREVSSVETDATATTEPQPAGKAGCCEDDSCSDACECDDHVCDYSGWGPRPTVSRKVFVKYQGNINVKAELYLRSCGIEVSE